MPIFSRLSARMHGEIPADDLDGLRRAGSMVYDLVAEVDRLRVDQQLAGRTPWTADAPVQAVALCAWTAFVLQTLGDKLLDVHDEHRASGYAPAQIHDQALAYYRSVQDWVRRGREAEGAAGAVSVGNTLPSHLPGPAGAWRQPYPPAHIEALRRGLEVIGSRAEAATRALLDASDAPAHPDECATLRRLLAAAATDAEFAAQAAAVPLADAARAVAGGQLHDAVDAWLVLGQLAAMPSLIEAYPARAVPG